MTRIYSVPGISCDHCKHAIEGSVRVLDGIEHVEVIVADKTVRVEGPADDATIRAAIAEEGYEVAGVASA